MDRVVALKVLPAGIAADTRACIRFMREAQAAGKLHHQNVVGVHSTGVNEGTPWYSMEYVEGETLAQILSKFKEADPERRFAGRRDGEPPFVIVVPDQPFKVVGNHFGEFLEKYLDRSPDLDP